MSLPPPHSLSHSQTDHQKCKLHTNKIFNGNYYSFRHMNQMVDKIPCRWIISISFQPTNSIRKSMLDVVMRIAFFPEYRLTLPDFRFFFILLAPNIESFAPCCLACRFYFGRVSPSCRSVQANKNHCNMMSEDA